jgi:hypothetical protein
MANLDGPIPYLLIHTCSDYVPVRLRLQLLARAIRFPSYSQLPFKRLRSRFALGSV